MSVSLLILAIGIIAIFYFQQRKMDAVLSVQSANSLKNFTVEELKKYDGSDPSLPIYLAMDGYVYDVTPGKEYYQPGGPYHSLAGRDSSYELNQFGGNIIKRKYKIAGILPN